MSYEAVFKCPFLLLSSSVFHLALSADKGCDLPQLRLKFQPFPRRRMSELNAFGMQVKAIGSLPVECVADDGAVKPLRMGAVDTQLVGATCDRVEFYLNGFGRLALWKFDLAYNPVVRRC